MDTEEFLDKLYQTWSRTTGAENQFWVVEEYDPWGPGNGYTGARWMVRAVSEDDKKFDVGLFENQADADFIAGVHGAIADLVRVTRTALDEAERLSFDRDQQEGRIADLELEILGYKQQLESQ